MSTLWEPSLSIPGAEASLFQALTKTRWEQSRPTATIYTAEGHRKIHRHMSGAHQKRHPGEVAH